MDAAAFGRPARQSHDAQLDDGTTSRTVRGLRPPASQRPASLLSEQSPPVRDIHAMSPAEPELALRRSTRSRHAPTGFDPVATGRPASRRSTPAEPGAASASATATHLPRTASAVSRDQRQRGRVCKTAGCDNYIVHQGLCCRHGGGKRCSVDGCSASAKHRGLCWRHGGSTECKEDGCTKKAKAKGVCWSHGGGTQCNHSDCTKIAISNGACWAHGGGKRCIHDGCQRPAYGRTNGFCEKHFRELQDIDYYEV